MANDKDRNLFILWLTHQGFKNKKYQIKRDIVRNNIGRYKKQFHERLERHYH